MTEWYWPTRVERVKALPRTHMGKVERARLRAWLASDAGLPSLPERASPLFPGLALRLLAGRAPLPDPVRLEDTG